MIVRATALVLATLMSSGANLFCSDLKTMPLGALEADVYNYVRKNFLQKSVNHLYVALTEEKTLEASIFEFQGDETFVRIFSVTWDPNKGWELPKRISDPVSLPKNYRDWLVRIIDSIKWGNQIGGSWYMGPGSIHIHFSSTSNEFRYRTDPFRDPLYFELGALLDHSRKYGR